MQSPPKSSSSIEHGILPVLKIALLKSLMSAHVASAYIDVDDRSLRRMARGYPSKDHRMPARCGVKIL
jgi:hypothetical protein